MRLDSRGIIHGTRAKSGGERLAHQAVRLAFLKHVIVDTRTRDLFERWGWATGLDKTIANYVVALDLAALHADLSHRSLLRRGKHRALPPQLSETLVWLANKCDDVLSSTRDARAAEVIAFIRGELLEPDTPMCAWLGLDLLDIFDAEVLGHIWDVKMRMPVLPSPVRGRVPKGQRPKNDGAHLAQYATWFYQACVAVPRVPEHELARRYDADQQAKGIFHKGDDRDRPSTSLVRHGIKEARRLLSLPIAPQHWLRDYFKK